MMTRFSLLVLLVGPLSAEVITLPDPHGSFPKDKTAVWSPLFQATWDAVNREMGGKPKSIQPPNELMDRLDHFHWQADRVMPESGWRVWGGRATPEFLRQVNEQAGQAFGEADFRVVDAMERSVACFGILERAVEFATPFCRSLRVPMKFGQEGHSVRFFGTSGEESARYRNHVKVLAYRPVDHSFALEVTCKGMDDKVIFYRPGAAQDFSKACTWIRTWRSEFAPVDSQARTWQDRFLHRDDEVKIPYVAFDTAAEMKDQLQGWRIYKNSPVPWTISRAEQKTRFALHEKGARVRMETSIQMDPFAETPSYVPRQFHFDRPFFLFLWRDQAEWPYLAVWVGDSECMQRME